MNEDLVLAGLLKDSKQHSSDVLINNLYVILDKLRQCFNQVDVVIVCNDDEVYANLCRHIRVANLHLILAPLKFQTEGRDNEKASHSYDYTRLHRMAQLRNLYLTYIRNHCSLRTYNYLGVLDMDLVGTFDSLDHMSKSIERLKHSDYDAISCNGKLAHWNHKHLYMYFDTFAFLDNLGRYASKQEKANPLFFLWRYPKLQNERISVLYPIKSGFGGFTLYKMARVKNNKYATHYVGNGVGWASEHISFNQNISMAHDPNLVFRITHNST